MVLKMTKGILITLESFPYTHLEVYYFAWDLELTWNTYCKMLSKHVWTMILFTYGLVFNW